MNEPLRVDAGRLRRARDRSAPLRESVAAVPLEIGRRMLERLQIVRLPEGPVLAIGAAWDDELRQLQAAVDGRTLAAFDSSFAVLAHRRAGTPLARRVWARWTGSALPVVQSALAPLPVRPQSSAMVWSNLMLHRVSDPAVAFRDWRLALRPGGLLMFSTLGPDTLREWRGARRAAGLGDDRSPFIDMHDIGDALVHAGFADPVMDMEQLTVTYGDVESLARELRGLGSIGPAHDAGRGLGGRDRWRRIAQGYEPWRRDGRLPATVEVVYGHAWVPEQGPRRTTDGLDVVRIHRAPGRR